jgi:predicted aspartyl protease
VIQIPYSPVLQPEAPVVNISVGHPNRPPQAITSEAQLDTGADRSVIPLAAVNRLRLRRLRTSQAVVAGGGVIVLAIYEVAISIPGVMDFVLEVYAGDEPHILLGRDVLNALHAHLDGPGRMLTLSVQPIAVTT